MLELEHLYRSYRSIPAIEDVSFKVAAGKGERYLNALKKHEAIIARNVTENLFDRHMKPLLLDDRQKESPGKISRLEPVTA